MAAHSLVTLAREFMLDEAGFLARHPHPWLIWSAGAPRSEPIIAPTLTLGSAKAQPNVGDPLAIAVLKGKASVFPMGITIGRTENNDVVLRHEQVSRFHAYLQVGEQGLALVDAESKNGTWVDEVRLVASRPHLLPERCEIRFGEVSVRYYSTQAFAAFMRNP